ncbi:MAG: hypothetical protein JNL60_00585, partial [Bacteroidia bacterium]|nr:hypothetical protein [Bacteroidia bacterium]
MKVFVIWVQVILCTWDQSFHAKILSLQNALEQKKVSIKVLSLGGHHGECIQMEIKNISTENLTLEIEAGRRLNSINDLEQDILIVKEQRVDIGPGETRETKVKGYCCQADKLSPSERSRYDVNKIAEMPL